MRTKGNADGVRPGRRAIAISVGDDIIAVQAIAASLKAEGIDTDVILSSDPYVGLHHTSPHRLMIHEADVDAARPIIAMYLPDLASRTTQSGESSSWKPSLGQGRRFGLWRRYDN